jgi:hypothetical protein
VGPRVRIRLAPALSPERTAGPVSMKWGLSRTPKHSQHLDVPLASLLDADSACLFDLRAGSRTAPIWTPPSDDSRYQIKQIDRDRRPVSAGSTPSGGGRIRTVGPWQPRSAASVDGAAPGVVARTMPISSEACPECPSYFQRNVKANSAQRNAGMMCSANNSIWRNSSSHGMNP